MKLCFNTGPEPVENYFSFAHEKGFKWVELSCNSPLNFLDKFDDKRISKIREMKDQYGLRYGLHTPSYVNTAEIEPTVRPAVCQHLIDYVELSRRLKAEYLVLHFGYHFSLHLDEVFRCLIETYKPVVELAEKYEIPIGIENMNQVHEDCEIVYLGVHIEELERVFDAIPSKYLGLTLDVAHAALLPGGNQAFIDKFPDRIVSTHVSDNDLYLDRHLPVGEGKIDFSSVLRQLNEVGFHGALNMELKTNQDRLLSAERIMLILNELGIQYE
ncbi:MAG: sugar phosphate isomerase/epimerase [Deltaproteobacteria bacterium]|jgi:sugar phosphate isomerase/epimerase|nr:sugar phosphate isomerase/epimerase [Deltaproteobacteria bacterium]MBW2478632.1 sugar phosphate isomerase/epimerase [Deltaproteobacteria bacterium]